MFSLNRTAAKASVLISRIKNWYETLRSKTILPPQNSRILEKKGCEKSPVRQICDKQIR